MLSVQSVICKLQPFMEQQGFSRTKACFYRIENHIAQCLEFESPGGMIYATCYIMPLYLPAKNRQFTYGIRLSAVPNTGVTPLNKNCDKLTFDQWCASYLSCFKSFAIPFYSVFSSPNSIDRFLETAHACNNEYFKCSNYHMERLRLFTHLFLGKNSELFNDIKQCRNALAGCSYLTTSTKKSNLAELEEVEHIVTLLGDVNVYCNRVIDSTLVNCSFAIKA